MNETNRKKNPSVFIVLLNYNGIEHLKYSLAPICETDYKNMTIVFVDNASTDESVAYIKENYSNLDIICLKKNSGWSGGNNAGIRYALEHDADYIALASNDIIVDKRWIKNAIAAAESSKEIGVIGFNVIGAIKKEPIELFHKASDNWSELSFEECEFIDGMAFCVKSSVFNSIGLIDETFLFYCEDTDFCIRASKFGFKIIKINIPIWHYSEGTLGNTPLKSSFYAIRHNIKLSIKHDNLASFTKKLALIIMIAGNPFYRKDDNTVLVKRFRPSNPLVNLSIVLYASIWNVVHLYETLKLRRKVREINKKGSILCVE